MKTPFPQRFNNFLHQPLSMIWIVVVILVFSILLWGYVSSTIILKVSPCPLEANPKTFGYEFKIFNTESEDGTKIEGWIVPSKKNTDSTLIVLHGWGGNKSDAVPATIFLAQNYNLIYFDFRNHGNSGIGRTSLGYYEIKDFHSVMEFLRKEKKEWLKDFAVYGFSMGGAIAISGSVDIKEVKAVVAESAFSSYNESVAHYAKLFYGVPRFFVPITILFTRARLGFDPDKYSPVRHISQLSPRPVFILQGEKDLRVPVKEGEALYRAAREPKEIWIVPEADHGEISEKTHEAYQKRISEFFKKWMSPA